MQIIFQSRIHRPVFLTKLHHVGLFVGAILLILASCIVSPQPSSAKGCNDVQFIFARGSGESLGDSSVTAWRESIEVALGKTQLQYGFYELGTTAQGGFRYPAVSVSDSLGGFGNLLGAYLSRGEFFEFGRSVTQGSGELQSYLHILSSACPRTKFVLGGYSQGAMVLSRTIEHLDSERIIYVATFGDPKLYLPEGKGALPPACLGQAHSDYRVYVPDCHAYEGVLGSQRPYQPAGYDNKIGVWCNTKDIMCSSGASIDDHVAYTSDGLYASAARKIKTRLKQTFPEAFANSQPKPWASAAHNVAFLFDTTVSMVNYLKGQTRGVQSVASKVIADGGSVAIAEFRDLDDPYEPQVLCDFGCTESEIANKLNTLPTYGGGDNPESALSGILHALNHLDWQDGAAKSIVLVTDEDYLSPDRDGTTLAQVVQRTLEIDPVNIYVLTRSQPSSSYAELTAQTNGALFNINETESWPKLEDALLYRPSAILNAPEFSGLVGDEFNFNASASEASDGGELRYAWDLDGDGKFEIVDGPANVTRAYQNAFSGYIQVKVTDSAGRSGTMSAKVNVSSVAPDLPEIYTAQVEALTPTTYRISYQTNAEKLLVSIDDTPAGYLPGATQEIVVTDIVLPTTLRLVPYTSNVGRGEGLTLSFGEERSPDLEPSPGPELAQPTQKPAIPTSAQVTIPRAPNTGVAPQHTTSSY